MDAERRWHSTNAGQDSKPLAWKFEGGEALWITGAFGLSILLFRILYSNWNWGLVTSITCSSLPGIAVGGVVLVLVHGKPPSHAKDFIEWVALKLAIRFGLSFLFGRRPQDNKHPIFCQEDITE